MSKPIVTFEEAIERVVRRYGFRDFALVARGADKKVRGLWVAGEQVDVIDDRERTLLLHSEMAILQSLMFDEIKKPKG